MDCRSPPGRCHRSARQHRAPDASSGRARIGFGRDAPPLEVAHGCSVRYATERVRPARRCISLSTESLCGLIVGHLADRPERLLTGSRQLLHSMDAPGSNQRPLACEVGAQSLIAQLSRDCTCTRQVPWVTVRSGCARGKVPLAGQHPEGRSHGRSRGNTPRAVDPARCPSLTPRRALN